MMRNFFSCLLLGICLANFVGCGGADRPPLGYVTGKVTIGGEPLTGAIVMFSPESGRPAVGTTDDTGAYEIQYIEGEPGCKVGPNDVMFAVPTGGSTSHPIPAKYQTKSDFKVDVKDGNNTFDFNLESDANAGKTAKPKPGVVD